MHGRGPKVNKEKNFQVNKEWMEGKKIGRERQVWVWEEPMSVPAGEQPSSHWEKINALGTSSISNI